MRKVRRFGGMVPRWWGLALVVAGTGCFEHGVGTSEAPRDAGVSVAADPGKVADATVGAGGGSSGSVPSKPNAQADAGVTAGTGGSPAEASASDASVDAAADGADDMGAPATCCSDGDCICRDDAPIALTSEGGPYTTEWHDIAGLGCVFYPTDAEPPFAAVTFAPAFLGQGCTLSSRMSWTEFLASHGIVAMAMNATTEDQPLERGDALLAGIAALQTENQDGASPLFQKLAGRYGIMGASMGGGGATRAAQADASLRTNVAILPWGTVTSGVSVPSLLICASADSVAPCADHGEPFYDGIGDSAPKMKVTVNGSHAANAPQSDYGRVGEVVLAFQKLFLEGDERWRPLLLGIEPDHTNIE